MRDQLFIPTPIGEVRIDAESNGEVLLASGELPHSLENGMSIDRSVACVLTVKPKCAFTDVHFSGTLVNADVRGFPATGECLDCIEWETDDWHLTLGTEDKAMIDRRLSGLGIPENPYPIAYTPSSMALILEGVRMQNTSTFHIVISFKRLPDDRECSAWFFADIPHAVANKHVDRT